MLVQAAYAEDGVDRSRVATALAAELAGMASWLGLGEVTVAHTGDLATNLRSAVA